MGPATHVLTVAGKSIGREHGLKPIPVACPDDRLRQRQILTDVIHATVRRCLPLAPEPQIEWQSTHKAVVWVQTDYGPFEVARFRVDHVHHFTTRGAAR